MKSLCRACAGRTAMRFGGLAARIMLVMALVAPTFAASPAMAVNTPPVSFNDPSLLSTLQKVTASDCATDAELGRAVAISGDTAVVGAFKDDDNGHWSGSAYVFVKGEDGVWAEQAKLTPNPGYADDTFGCSVAIDGDTIVVGAEQNDAEATDAGAAYVFTRTDATWTKSAVLIAGDYATGDYFGSSVAVQGDTILVGAYYDDDTDTNTGSVYVFTGAGSSWLQRTKLHASDAGASDYFGCSVALDNGTAVVGAKRDDIAETDEGSAYVFTGTGDTWVEQGKLTASDYRGGAWFGNAVDVSGDAIVVGSAFQDTLAGNDTGEAYIFTRSGGSWTQTRQLIAPDAATEDYFGWSVGIHGNEILVGAPYDDVGGSGSGSVYAFSLRSGSWVQRKKYTPGSFSDMTGFSVGIDGDNAVAGANGCDTGASEAGAAQLFSTPGGYLMDEDTTLTVSAAQGLSANDIDVDGQTLTVNNVWPASHGSVSMGVGGAFEYRPNPDWYGTDTFRYTVNDGIANSQSATVTIVVAPVNDAPVAENDPGLMSTQATVTAGDGGASDRFGAACDISGDTAIVGADLDDDLGLNSGAAFVYVREGSEWVQQAKLLAAGGSAGDWFGRAVAIEGDTAVVSAPFADSPNGDAGYAAVFTRNGTTWSQVATLTGDGAADTRFGYALDISGDTLVAGSGADNGWAGAVYVFTGSGASWSRQAKLVASDGEYADEMGNAVAVDGDVVVAGARGDDADGYETGSAYVFERAGASWSQTDRITPSDPSYMTYFGDDVAVSGSTIMVGRVWTNSVYVYNKGGDDWAQSTKLTASDEDGTDGFGFSVGLDDGTAIIGAYTDDAPAVDSGSAYVFKGAGSNWVEARKLTALDGSAGDNLGFKVAVDGDQAVATSEMDDTPGGGDAGSACLFFGDAFAATEDTLLTGDVPGLLANDGDTEDDALTVVSWSDALHGTPLAWTDGHWSYLPDSNWYGTDSFTYTASDGRGGTDTGTVTIRVTPVNDAPTAVDDTATVGANETLNVGAPGVLGNDSDVEDDPLSASVEAQPAHGELTLNANGSYEYVPTPGFSGADAFAYRVSDGQASSVATVSIDVEPPPVTSFVIASDDTTLMAYGAAFRLTGTLMYGETPLGDRRVVLQQCSSATGTFTATSYATTTSAEGTFTLPGVVPASRTYYRAWFAGAPGGPGDAASGAVRVMPSAYVSTPRAPSTMYRSRYYTVYGYLKPRHTSGSYPVRIYKYRYVSGKWKSYGYVKAKVANYSSYSKYSVKMKLPYAGKWYLRAYAPADSGHAATWSSSHDHVTVR